MSETPDIESRTLDRAVEVRSSGSGGKLRVGGYAALFNSRSEPLGSFREVVSPNFFNKSRGDGWPAVTALYEHDNRMLLGATASGTLRLAVDIVGLDYEVDLPESRSDVYESISRGDVSASSFSFLAYEDSFDWDDGLPLRTLLSGRLLHVSPVTQPAYSQTSVSLRSLARHMDAPYEEIRSAYADGNLARFFTRSDRGQQPAKTRTRSGRQAVLETMALHPSVQQTPLTVARMRKQLTDLRYPAKPRSGAEARAELTRMAPPAYGRASD